MKLKIVMAILGAAILATVTYRFRSTEREAPPPFGAERYRLDAATYHRLVKAAEAGDCDAAYHVARHYVFYAVDRNEAIRWYRIAAKCPHADAKDELLNLLVYTAADDAEVDRLLSELELIDPKMAKHDRESVAAMRSIRDRPSQ